MTVTVTRDSDLAYKDSPSRSALVFNLDLVCTPALGLCLSNSLDSNLCGFVLRWPSLTMDCPIALFESTVHEAQMTVGMHSP